MAEQMGSPGYKVTDKYGTNIYTDRSFVTDYAGGGMENWYRAQDMSKAQNGVNSHMFADFLRESPVFGNGTANPSYKAEAIFIDVSAILSGSKNLFSNV